MRPHVAKSRQRIVVAARRCFLRELLKMRKTLPPCVLNDCDCCRSFLLAGGRAAGARRSWRAAPCVLSFQRTICKHELSRGLYVCTDPFSATWNHGDVESRRRTGTGGRRGRRGNESGVMIIVKLQTEKCGFQTKTTDATKE